MGKKRPPLCSGEESVGCLRVASLNVSGLSDAEKKNYRDVKDKG